MSRHTRPDRKRQRQAEAAARLAYTQTNGPRTGTRPNPVRNSDPLIPKA